VEPHAFSHLQAMTRDPDREVLVVRPPTNVRSWREDVRLLARHCAQGLAFIVLLSAGIFVASGKLLPARPTDSLEADLRCFTKLRQQNVSDAQCRMPNQPDTAIDDVLTFIQCSIDVTSRGDLTVMVDEDAQTLTSVCVEGIQRCLLNVACRALANRAMHDAR